MGTYGNIIGKPSGNHRKLCKTQRDNQKKITEKQWEHREIFQGNQRKTMERCEKFAGMSRGFCFFVFVLSVLCLVQTFAFARIFAWSKSTNAPWNLTYRSKMLFSLHSKQFWLHSAPFLMHVLSCFLQRLIQSISGWRQPGHAPASRAPWQPALQSAVQMHPSNSGGGCGALSNYTCIINAHDDCSACSLHL